MLSLPSLIIALLLVVYWVVMAFAASAFMKRTGAGGRFVPWPGPAWGAGLGAAAAWAVVALFSCCLPARASEGGKVSTAPASPYPPIAAYGGPGDGMGHHAGGPGGTAQAALGLPGLGFSVIPLARSHSGGGGLGPPRASSGGPSTAPPFTAGLDPEDAAALGAPSAPPGLPAGRSQTPPSQPRVPSFHGPSRPGGDLPPRGVGGFFARRASGKEGNGGGGARDPGV